MNIKVRRLRDLTNPQLKALGLLLRKLVHSDKSEWVCQARQQPHFWSQEYLRGVAKNPDDYAVDVWVGAADGDPAGLCWVCRGDPNRDIVMFLIDPRLTKPEQVQVADEIALFSIDDMLNDDSGKRNLHSLFPDGTPAAAYAKLCKFRATPIENSDLVRWEIGMQELKDNILERRNG